MQRPTPALPFVSVIIPVYLHQVELAACLQELARQSYPCGRWEIVVVDNHSAPVVDRVTLHSGPPIHVVHCPDPSAYAARNAGARMARGDIFAFTDADCLPDSNWIAAGVESLTHRTSISMVAGRVEFVYDRLSPSTIELFETSFFFNQPRNVSGGFSVTANMFVHAGVFQRLGGFEPNIRSRGDTEFGLRLRRAGGTVAYAPQAITRHRTASSYGRLITKVRRLEGGRRDLSRLFPEREWNPFPLKGSDLLFPWRQWTILAHRFLPGSPSWFARAALLVLFFNWVTFGERLRLGLGTEAERR